ncbi:MAG: aldo/keto reductase [Nanoarchaeota archaeon]
MQTTRIGTSSCLATALGLGTWSFGGDQWEGQEDKDSLATLQAAIEAGITHIDTAQGYGNGHSEELVGKFLTERSIKRGDLFIATKFFLDPKKEVSDFVQESLQRLQTSYLDLMYIHWPNKDVPDMRTVMQALEAERKKGTVRGIGVSNFSVEQMKQVSEAGKIDAHQLCYNLLWRSPEKDVLPYCKEQGIPTVIYSPLLLGILTGKYGSTPPQFGKDDIRGRMVVHFKPAVYPYVYSAVEEMKAVAQDVGRPLVHLALQWLFHQNGVGSVLVGARNPEQFRENMAALENPLPEQVLNQLTEISDRFQPYIPETGNIFDYHP